MKKVKKLTKYTLNTFAVINAILIGLAPIWELDIYRVTGTITVFVGVLGGYLLSDKAVLKYQEVKNNECTKHQG